MEYSRITEGLNISDLTIIPPASACSFPVLIEINIKPCHTGGNFDVVQR